MRSNHEILRMAIEAAIQAGDKILEVYDSPFEVEIKEDNSPLTEADKRANAAINHILNDSGIPIISEENKQVAYEVRKDYSCCWMVDPLDGTKEFVKRNGEFTVNIAYIEGETPQLGVIYVPVSRRIYYTAHPSQGAFTNMASKGDSVDELIASAERIQASDPDSEWLNVVGSRSHMNERTSNYFELLRNQGHQVKAISAGSALKFCLLAEGKADVYPRFAPTMEWDTAAGHAICLAVGLDVIQIDGGKPLVYNKADLLNPYFLVYNPKNAKIKTDGI